MGEFALFRRAWRGQIVIRFGPSAECFDICIRDEQKRYRFVIQKNPLENLPTVAFLAKPWDRIKSLDEEEFDPFALKHAVRLYPENLPSSPNPTKNTPAWIYPLDAGKAEFIEDKPEFKKLQFGGKRLKGTFVFAQESPDSDIWTMEVSTGPETVKSSQDVRIFKKSEARRVVYGIILEPNEVDLHHHIISADEIERAAEFYMLESQRFDYEHKRMLPKDAVRVVQSFVAPVDFDWPVGDDAQDVFHVKRGTWIVAAKIFDDEIWNQILNGEINAFSIHALGKVKPLEERNANPR